MLVDAAPSVQPTLDYEPTVEVSNEYGLLLKQKDTDVSVMRTMLLKPLLHKPPL